MPGPVASATFSAGPGRWRFSSARPDSDLEPVVAEYWEVEGAMAPFRESVVPNACVELMINLGPVHHLLTDDRRVACTTAWISGLQSQALQIETLLGTHLVSVRLWPLGARRVLGIPMREFANRVVDLESVMGPAAGSLRDAVLSARTPGGRFHVLERFVRTRIAGGVAARPLARWLEETIAACHGSCRMETLANDAGFSRKHLSAVLQDQVGLSPKAYARIHRFLWVVGELRRHTAVDWLSLAHAAGFADQAHLSREFQRIAGANPTTFLRTVTPDGVALLAEASGGR